MQFLICYSHELLQRVLEHCDDPKTQQIMMDEILQSVCLLAQDQYGNYVVQVSACSVPKEIHAVPAYLVLFRWAIMLTVVCCLPDSLYDQYWNVDCLSPSLLPMIWRWTILYISYAAVQELPLSEY